MTWLSSEESFTNPDYSLSLSPPPPTTKTPLYELYIDLDQTLCDFEAGLHALFPQTSPNALPPPNTQWNVMESAPGFFANLAWLSDGEYLWNHVSHLLPSILTGSAADWAVPQKQSWCATHLNLTSTLNINNKSLLKTDPRLTNIPPSTVITARTATKYWLAKPHRILIDDLASTGEKWTKAGGIFILRTNDPSNAHDILKQLHKMKVIDTLPPPPLPPLPAIFVNLDGVFSDFTKAVRKEFNIAPDAPTPSNATVFPHISEIPGFFSNLPWTSDGPHLWCNLSPFNPTILATTPAPWAVPQKQSWCATNLNITQTLDVSANTIMADSHQLKNPPPAAVITLLKKDISRLAAPRRVLIDVNEDHRAAWELSNGTFIHHTTAVNTLQLLMEALPHLLSPATLLPPPEHPPTPLPAPPPAVDPETIAADPMTSTELRAIMLDNYKEAPADNTKCNRLPFCQIVDRLETIEKNRTTIPSKQDILLYLLPQDLFEYLKPAGSGYPYLRLIMPGIDNGRPCHYGMKESMIAEIWGLAMGLDPKSVSQQRLSCYKDPTRAGMSTATDLASSVSEELARRQTADYSTITIGKMNDLLDELAIINHKGATNVQAGPDANVATDSGRVFNHTSEGVRTNPLSGSVAAGIHSSDMSRVSANVKLPKNPYLPKSEEERGQEMAPSKSTKQKRIEWARNLTSVHNLSPIEQKWIIRVIMSNLDIGINHETILKYLHPQMIRMYSAVQNLEVVCQQLGDAEFMRRKAVKEAAVLRFENEMAIQNAFNTTSWQRTNAVSCGTMFAPMLSDRTNFPQLLTDLKKRVLNNPAVLKIAAGCTPAAYKERLQAMPLNLKHPPFLAEIKLDGERMMFHVKRGIVQVHSRRANWFSEIYSPVLGPKIRAALSKYDVDVVLDGEVLSWDDNKKQIINFGLNRAIAKMRAEYLRDKNLVEQRDCKFEKRSGDTSNHMSMTMFNSWDKGSTTQQAIQDRAKDKMSNPLTGNPNKVEDDDDQRASDHPGSFLWLTYTIFDICYVGGPDAKKFMTEIGCADRFDDAVPSPNKEHFGGSVMHLDLNLRKKILYNIIKPQPHEVEISYGVVITSDGRTVDAERYFKAGGREADNKSNKLDRASSKEEDEDFEKARAISIDRFYTRTVDNKGEEGLVVKELSSPYVFGSQHSRAQAYWRKIKPDYGDVHAASDIDAVVIGAFFADGRSRRGMITSFLVGLADDNPDAVSRETKYMTFCCVSGCSMDEFQMVQNYTGYKNASKSNDKVQLGNWILSSRNRKEIPSFVSSKSYQRDMMNGDDDGWNAFSKKDWPDLWIHPKDSFVVEIKAGEMVLSSEHSSGVTLRFPRITKLRIDHGNALGGEKPPHLCETVSGVKRMYSAKKAEASMRGSNSGNENRRFLTETERNKKVALKKRAMKPKGIGKSLGKMSSVAVLDSNKVASKFFEGLTFCVLPGTYRLDQGTVDAEHARTNKYHEQVSKVSNKQGVERFIMQHSGICVVETIKNDVADFYVGGKGNDAKIVAMQKGLEKALADLTNCEEGVGGIKLSKQKREHYESMGNVKVLRWTWIFSTIARMWHGREDEGGGIMPQPGSMDFLVINEQDRRVLRGKEDRLGFSLKGEYDVLGVKKVFEKMGREREEGHEELGGVALMDVEAAGDWQEGGGALRTNAKEQWVMQGVNCAFWGEEKRGAVVVLNGGDGGAGVGSAGLLVRAMGGRVVKEEFEVKEVTHILVETLQFKQSMLFRDMKGVSELREQFRKRAWWNDVVAGGGGELVVVTPGWVRGQWKFEEKGGAREKKKRKVEKEREKEAVKGGNACLVVLCGFPGSGKSTFCGQLQSKAGSGVFVSVCQDVFGTREKCELVAKRALGRGCCVVIDRTNMTVADRALWLEMGRSAGVTRLVTVKFDVRVEVCARRCDQRLENGGSHPTIKRKGEAGIIIEQMKGRYEPPRDYEGAEVVVVGEGGVDVSVIDEIVRHAAN